MGSSVGMAFTAADMYHTMAPAAMTKFSRGLVSFISLGMEWMRGTEGNGSCWLMLLIQELKVCERERKHSCLNEER